MNRNQVFLTVDVEEWFHTNWFDVPNVIRQYYGGEYPKTDVVKRTKELVDTFDSYGAEATFFVLGETAEKYPELIEILNESQHEIGCHNWYHNKVYNNLYEFKHDILRFKEEIYPSAKGFRFPNFSYSLEKFKIILKQGFIYDSSIVPSLKIPRWYGNLKSPIKPHKLNLGDKIYINEFPISVMPYLRLPGAGGWFLRNLGYQWTKNIVKFSLKKTGYAMIYMHPWGCSDSNPNIEDIPFHVFRNTGNKTLNNLKKLIETFSGNEFLKISDSKKLKEK